MVGAGNTGATMAAALLRFGRIKGVHRPAIAVPLPVFGEDRLQLLVDGGATVDPDPEWLVEWAELARAYARVRLGVAEPTIALLSNGEEPGKGDALRKRAVRAVRRREGVRRQRRGPRRRARRSADVIVTDGFTGNVTLKTLEGAVMGLAGLVFGVVDEPGAPWADAADALKLRLLEAAAPLLPDNTGGAMLLGVEGVCVISHGSSSATAIVNAVRVARDSVHADVVGEAARGGRRMPAETHSHLGPVGGDDVERVVRDQLVEILGVDPDAVTLDTRLREDLDADDFAVIDLVEGVIAELGERTVGFSIDDDDLVELRTVRDAVECALAGLRSGRRQSSAEGSK